MLTHTELGAAEESEWDLLAVFISGFALCINSEECERVVNIQFLRGRSTDRVCRFKRRQLHFLCGVGKRSGMSSSWFEIAPSQMITVERRCSPKQRTLGTILEKVSAMGLWLEAAPPQIITVERICSPGPRTLDTIAEESMTMVASHLASSTETADHVFETYELQLGEHKELETGIRFCGMQLMMNSL